MRVTVVRGGGVAGMTLTLVLDTADLDDADAAGLRGLVGACAFDEPVVDLSPPVADGFAYEVSVEHDDGTVARTRFRQGAAPTGAGPLTQAVLDSPHGHRSVGR